MHLTRKYDGSKTEKRWEHSFATPPFTVASPVSIKTLSPPTSSLHVSCIPLRTFAFRGKIIHETLTRGKCFCDEYGGMRKEQQADRHTTAFSGLYVPSTPSSCKQSPSNTCGTITAASYIRTHACTHTHTHTRKCKTSTLISCSAVVSFSTSVVDATGAVGAESLNEAVESAAGRAAGVEVTSVSAVSALPSSQ